MTLIGKLFAFINLLVGIGIISWSVSVYMHRPGWFEKVPPAEGVDKGNEPQSFEQIKGEVEALNRVASAASASWGTQIENLKTLEDIRAKRSAVYVERLKWAREGDKDGNGFYAPIYQGDGLVDITKVGDPINGSNKLPLKGADKLMTTFTADVAKTVEMSKATELKRKEFGELGVKILQAEARLLKMNEIRDSVQSELFYLSSFELNVYETRETVFRRKRQLVARLAELGVK